MFSVVALASRSLAIGIVALCALALGGLGALAVRRRRRG